MAVTTVTSGSFEREVINSDIPVLSHALFLSIGIILSDAEYLIINKRKKQLNGMPAFRKLDNCYGLIDNKIGILLK